jgi:hypothetical protein
MPVERYLAELTLTFDVSDDVFSNNQPKTPFGQ